MVNRHLTIATYPYLSVMLHNRNDWHCPFGKCYIILCLQVSTHEAQMDVTSVKLCKYIAQDQVMEEYGCRYLIIEACSQACTMYATILVMEEILVSI